LKLNEKGIAETISDVILKLIEKNPKFIIRTYLNDEELRDLLEEKDFEMIENKLKSKKAVKENMDELVRDIAESFAFSILYENK